MPNDYISRRRFLKNAGAITIGFSLTTGCQLSGNEILSDDNSLPSSLAAQPQINAWLQVLEDGRILIFTGKMELGQGIRIAIAQVAAEELNTIPDMVEVHLAETDITPDEGYTAGSRSIESSAMSVRYASATAGEILIDRASEKLNVDRENLYLETLALFLGK